jgi:Bacterial Ig domain
LLGFIDLKEFHLILLLTAIFFCFVQSNSSGNYSSYAQGQTLQSRDNQAQQTSPSIEPALSVKITSPSNGQNVSTGQLTISGTSTDTSLRECEVYADWNDRKPFQRVVAAGSEGNDDYSRWNYTYTADYHEITNGTNELTSKISCLASPTNLTKWYSINVTGIEGLISLRNDSSKSGNQEQGNSMPNLNNISSPVSTISTAEITAPRHGSYTDLEGSESSSENDNDDVEDNGREDRDERDEEKGGENDFTIGGENDFTTENNHDNEVANNENPELISNENNREEDEEDDEDDTSDDNGREDRDEGDEEKGGENDFTIGGENDFTTENNHDNEVANNENPELISNENNREEDEEDDEDDTPENDFEDSDQSENESQESLSEDKNSIEKNLEVFGDNGKYEDKDRSGGEESEIHSPFDIPFEVSILTMPSVPSLPTPDLEDLAQSEDDNCDIGDTKFPFCDERED